LRSAKQWLDRREAAAAREIVNSRRRRIAAKAPVQGRRSGLGSASFPLSRQK
jgi:hypothetical protein